MEKGTEKRENIEALYERLKIFIEYCLFQIICADKSLPVSMPESSTAHTVIHPTSQQLTHVDENFNPTFIHTLKQISSSQVLHMLAQERSWLAASEVTKAIVIGLERKQLLIATEEVGWLGLPVASLDDNAAGEAPGPDAISVYPVLRKTSGK